MLKQPSHFAEISQCFDQLALTGTKPVIVAISGGSDSTALLTGLKKYFATHNVSAPIVAVTIDHGLRPEAAQEAAQVGNLCQSLDVEHIIRKWERQSSASGIQAAAREARYDLIGEVARELGAQLVLTGHTLDDQLETVSMRALRGHGRGLAGISPATLYDRSTWFVRPLLHVRRDDLRTYLSRCDIDWIDDPSNENLDFERVRVRKTQISNAEKNELLHIQSTAQLAREDAAQAGARILLDHNKLSIDPHLDECRFGLEVGESEGFETALQTVMCKVGRRAHFASSATLKQILDFARAGKNGEKFTAHGCLLTINARNLAVRSEDRARSDGIYCFDYLLPSTDFALAHALNLRLKRSKLPEAPIKYATR